MNIKIDNMIDFACFLFGAGNKRTRMSTSKFYSYGKGV